MLTVPSLHDVMTKNVYSVLKDTSIGDAKQILNEKKISRVLVVSDRKPVGIITEKDITRSYFRKFDKFLKDVTAEEIMSQNVATTHSNATIFNCAKIMSSRRISSVAILAKDGSTIGIITNTDIVKVFSKLGIPPREISNIMSSQVITASSDESLLSIESMMSRYKISRIIIQKDKVPLGVISSLDFVPVKIPYWIGEHAAPDDLKQFREKHKNEFHDNLLRNIAPFKARDIMTHNPITVNRDEDIEVAATLIAKNNVGGLPVLYRKKLTGFVTKNVLAFA